MLIKIEAINIYSFVNEAQNLNSVRGGGLMLLELPEKFETWMKGRQWQAQRIQSGASKAVFEIKAGPGKDVVEDEAARWLKDEYPHCTIGLAVVERPSGDFVKEEDRLTLEIRKQQMRSFSIAGTDLNGGRDVCEWDRVRPGVERIPARENPLVSRATAERYTQGRELKAEFFQRYGGAPENMEFTWDLQELAGKSDAGVLKDKIAIFYADGNHFSKKLRSFLEKPNVNQRKLIGRFDEEMRNHRKSFLKALLNKAEDRKWQTADGSRRIEILLWGGDELMVAVPAWCGWETVETFAETMLGKDFHEARIPLRYAMGLIFAHAKAPIHALTSLVKDLAEEAKYQSREKDLLSYLVLESFDHVGEELERFRRERCKSTEVAARMTIPVSAKLAAKMRESMRLLKEAEFPRRRLFHAAQALAGGETWADIQARAEKGLKKPQADALATWCEAAAEKHLAAGWWHLAELWDYVGTGVAR